MYIHIPRVIQPVMIVFSSVGALVVTVTVFIVPVIVVVFDVVEVLVSTC